MSEISTNNQNGFSFNDNVTSIMYNILGDFEELIYDIEDGLSSLEDNEEAIIEYLNNIRCSMPLGLALRRYICSQFSDGFDENTKTFTFNFGDGKTYTVSDYRSDDYDITTHDVKEFTEIFMLINEKYNTDENGNLVSEINKAEARRLLKVDTACTRSKLFSISFALHMNSNVVVKFLTDVLAEQSYNYRNPDEIIAYFCHSHEELNNYIDFVRLKNLYSDKAKALPVEDEAKDGYTKFARRTVALQVETEEQLIEFLLENRSNFSGYSRTIYNEFMELFTQALEKSKIQMLSNDDYLNYISENSQGEFHDHVERINRAIGLQEISNTEQLAKAMFMFIPRATTEKDKGNGQKVISNDFIPISNGENGQKSKKIQTTTLPKEITMNLLLKDRLDDLIKQKKPVERKDLVFLKFYLFNLDLQEEDREYSSSDYQVFVYECNDILLRCGMSKLYPANRFENLIFLSLVSSNPFEMFENIIEYSFMNEPGSESDIDE